MINKQKSMVVFLLVIRGSSPGAWQSSSLPQACADGYRTCLKNVCFPVVNQRHWKWFLKNNRTFKSPLSSFLKSSFFFFYMYFWLKIIYRYAFPQWHAIRMTSINWLKNIVDVSLWFHTRALGSNLRVWRRSIKFHQWTHPWALFCYCAGVFLTLGGSCIGVPFVPLSVGQLKNLGLSSFCSSRVHSSLGTR